MLILIEPADQASFVRAVPQEYGCIEVFMHIQLNRYLNLWIETNLRFAVLESVGFLIIFSFVLKKKK